MSKFLENGNTLRLTNITGTYEKLPVGVYNLDIDDAGFFLSRTNDLTLPKKIYGDMSIVDRWLNTYRQRERNLGVLLSGLKGSGKTIMAKMLAIKSGLPVINVQAAYKGTVFTSFITNEALGDCVFFLDEYEKVYSNTKNGDEDSSLLSILDGPYSTHHLFIFTVNETRINSNLMNRPSRIFYHKNFQGLPKEQIQEIAEDLLINKDMVDNLVVACDMIPDASFDTVISIIEEMNRYGESAMDCMVNMNLSPETIRFNAYQYYINEYGEPERVYAGDNVEIEYDGITGEPFVEVRFNWYKYRHDTDKGKSPKMIHDTSWISLPYESFERTSADTFEYYNGEMLFVLKKQGRTFYGYDYYNNKIKVKNPIPKAFVCFIDENDSCNKYQPENYNKSYDLIKHEFKNNSPFDLGPGCEGPDCDKAPDF